MHSVSEQAREALPEVVQAMRDIIGNSRAHDAHKIQAAQLLIGLADVQEQADEDFKERVYGVLAELVRLSAM